MGKAEKSVLKSGRTPQFVMGFARHIIPRGGKYPDGADDDPELVDRLDDFVRSLDSLSKLGLKLAFFHINYWNLINILIMAVTYALAGVLLRHFSAGTTSWVLVMGVLTIFFAGVEMFQSLHFGIEPLYKMDEEKAHAYLQSFENSRLALKRQLFMALKGMVCIAFYSSEKFEKYLGVYHHYRSCGG